MHRRLPTVLIVAAAIVAVGFLVLWSWRSAKKQEKAIDAFSARIVLGMPGKQASGILGNAANNRSGWRYQPIAFSHSDVAALESPLAFGATNHVLYVVFDQDVVSAVLVRTLDSAKYRPSNAPQDRITDPTLSALKDFY